MKKCILFLLIFSLFASCDKTQDMTIDTQNIPDIVVKAITNNFADATNLTFTTLKAKDLYAADFTSNKLIHNAIIGGNGNIKELTVQSTLTLPPSITAYINANYPNAYISNSYLKYDNNKIQVGYNVQITTTTSKNLELSFDLAGAWISTIDIPATSVVSKYLIAKFEDLPENIRTYLNSHHAGLTYYYGVGVVVDNVTTFYVSVKLGDILHNYSFNANAQVLSYTTSSLVNNTGGSSTSTQKSMTTAADIPSVSVTYLNNNFAGWQFLKGLIYYESNVITSYLVVTKVGNDLYYISFDVNGAFTGAKKG